MHELKKKNLDCSLAQFKTLTNQLRLLILTVSKSLYISNYFNKEFIYEMKSYFKDFLKKMVEYPENC